MAKRLKAAMLWLGFGQYRWFRRWYGGHWETWLFNWYPSPNCLLRSKFANDLFPKMGYRCEHWGE